MLLQIRFIPPPRGIIPSLLLLGRGLGQIFNPAGPQRQRFLDLLAANPEILESFREAQIQAEEQALATVPTTEEAIAAADPTQPVPPVAQRLRPNILGPFGFDLEETEAILRAVPETPEARQRRLELAAGLPEIRVAGDVARAQAETTLAQSLVVRGVPALRAAIVEKQADLELSRALFDTREFKAFEGFVRELPEADRRLMDFAKFEPEFLRTKTTLTIAQARARAAAATEPLEISERRFALAQSYDKEISRLIQEAREAKTDEEVQLKIQQLNSIARQMVIDLPNRTFTFLAEADERWLWLRTRINLRVFGPSDILARVQDNSISRLVAAQAEGIGLQEEDLIVAQIQAHPQTGPLWAALSDDDKELWKIQLRERARIQRAAEAGDPITASDAEQLAAAAQALLKTPGLPGDAARAITIIGVVGQGFGVLKRALERVLGISLEAFQNATELTKFLLSEEGRAAMRAAPTPQEQGR